MPVVLDLYTENQKLQATNRFLSYHLRKTGSLATQSRIGGNTTASSLLVPTTGMSASAFCAVQSLGYSAGLVQKVTLNGTQHWNFATSAPIGTAFNYFIFDQSSSLPPSPFGLELRNEATGQIAFSSTYRPMTCLAMLGSPSGLWNAGGYGGYYDDPPTATFANKSLATFNTAWAGHRVALNIRCFGNTRPIGEDCENGYIWSNNGKVYGGAITNGGATASSTAISWDDVTAGPSQNGPPEDFTIPLKLFVVDVTGAPIGQTFF